LSVSVSAAIHSADGDGDEDDGLLLLVVLEAGLEAVLALVGAVVGKRLLCFFCGVGVEGKGGCGYENYVGIVGIGIITLIMHHM
jgi:hypothetical protein